MWSIRKVRKLFGVWLRLFDCQSFAARPKRIFSLKLLCSDVTPMDVGTTQLIRQEEWGRARSDGWMWSWGSDGWQLHRLQFLRLHKHRHHSPDEKLTWQPCALAYQLLLILTHSQQRLCWHTLMGFFQRKCLICSFGFLINPSTRVIPNADHDFFVSNPWSPPRHGCADSLLITTSTWACRFLTDCKRQKILSSMSAYCSLPYRLYPSQVMLNRIVAGGLRPSWSQAWIDTIFLVHFRYGFHDSKHEKMFVCLSSGIIFLSVQSTARHILQAIILPFSEVTCTCIDHEILAYTSSHTAHLSRHPSCWMIWLTRTSAWWFFELEMTSLIKVLGFLWALAPLFWIRWRIFRDLYSMSCSSSRKSKMD